MHHFLFSQPTTPRILFKRARALTLFSTSGESETLELSVEVREAEWPTWASEHAASKRGLDIMRVHRLATADVLLHGQQTTRVVMDASRCDPTTNPNTPLPCAPPLLLLLLRETKSLHVGSYARQSTLVHISRLALIPKTRLIMPSRMCHHPPGKALVV